MEFIGEKADNTETSDIILYKKHFCDKIPAGDGNRKDIVW